jgi:hypothetical protein
MQKSKAIIGNNIYLLCLWRMKIILIIYFIELNAACFCDFICVQIDYSF